MEYQNEEQKLVSTGSHLFAEWLTVQDAVAYCLTKGLSRTPKTVRKWALRSQSADSDSGEIVARTQDTENGFRWLIERASLDIKIAQELEFDARREASSFHPNLLEPVATGVDAGTDVQANDSVNKPVQTGSHQPEQVHTSAVTDFGYITFLEKQLDRAHQQIDVKDRQIDSLLERDRETNILIQGLQSSLTKVVDALPDGRRDYRDAA